MAERHKFQRTSYLVVPHSALSPVEMNKTQEGHVMSLWHILYKLQCSTSLNGFNERQHDYWESCEWCSANTIHLTKPLSSLCWNLRGPRGPCGVLDVLSEQRKGGGGCSVYMLGREGFNNGDTEQCLCWFTEPFVVCFQRHMQIIGIYTEYFLRNTVGKQL